MTVWTRRLRRRPSLAPAAVAFLLGLCLHAAEQALFVRAGPGPVLVTVPVVAALVYLRDRPATVRRLLALAAWGVVSSGVATIALYLRVVNDVLPRPLTGAEMVAYDLALFVWFVLAFAAAAAVAARAGRRRALVALALAPAVQASFALLVPALVALGLWP